MRTFFFFFLLAALLGTSVLAAQQPRRLRRLELMWAAGTSGSGAPAPIQAAMAAAGLGDTYPAGCFLGWCWPDQNHPGSLGSSLTVNVAASYALRPWWVVRLQSGRADLGETTGYHAPAAWLTVRPSVRSTSALTLVRHFGLQVGAGPAFHRVTISGADYEGARSHHNKIGLTLVAGVFFPERTRFFFDLSYQQHIVGSVDIGPLRTSDPTVTLPRTRASLSYHTVKAGMGLRL